VARTTSPARRDGPHRACEPVDLGSVPRMEIVAALYVENIEFRQVAGPSTRIDITGAFFSTQPSGYPATLTPHLVVLVREPAGGDGAETLEVVFRRDGEEVGRNVQQFMVEPGKFGYRLVRGELEFPEPGTVEAHCRLLTSGSSVTVPLTALPAP
jgi:hypothetical protein